MEERRAPHQEMVRQDNRYVLGTFKPDTIAYARMAIIEARELEIPEQEEAVLDFLMSTAGLDGRARDALRDAVAGRQQPTPGVGTPPPVAGGTARSGAAW